MAMYPSMFLRKAGMKAVSAGSGPMRLMPSVRRISIAGWMMCVSSFPKIPFSPA